MRSILACFLIISVFFVVSQCAVDEKKVEQGEHKHHIATKQAGQLEKNKKASGEENPIVETKPQVKSSESGEQQRKVSASKEQSTKSKSGEEREKSKKSLVHEKKEHVLFERQIEHFLNNPVTRKDRQCFAKFKPGQSIDFVIDIAPSPSNDKIDNLLAESPMALYLERTYRTPSRAYFSAVQLFIDAVTLDMKPEFTHACIYDQGRKYFLRGRGVEDVEWSKRFEGSEFTDSMRNLKTLWPVPTKEAVSNLAPIVSNNLGRMTKLALWNRDNGLPTVLSATRRSKPIYTIVISDGSSGAKLNDLVEDASLATVIDIGNRRFVNAMSWDEMRKCAGVYSLTAPQMLPFMLDTVRNMACLFGEHSANSITLY